MSASVDMMAPCILSRLNRLHSQAPTRPPVSRVLFGVPDQDKLNQTWCSEEMNRIRQEKKSRWNFDFDNGKPLEGKLQWVPMKPGTVPQAYQVKRLSILSSKSMNEQRDCQDTVSPSKNEKTVSISRSCDDSLVKKLDCSCLPSSVSLPKSESNVLVESTEWNIKKQPRKSKITEFYRARKRSLLEKGSVVSQPPTKTSRKCTT